MEEFTPQKTFIITDLETLRTVADPLRTQIYEILIPAPANVKQIAERLGLAPSRLYYHINLMEKAGLIKVVETRMVANMLEKYYRAAAYDIDVAPELLNFTTDEGKTVVGDVLITGLDATRDDLLRTMEARMRAVEQGAEQKSRSVMVSRVTARIPDTYADAFRERLQTLIQEFTGQDASAGEGSESDLQNYALMVAFYPSFYYGES